jgi:hypothetical protein
VTVVAAEAAADAAPAATAGGASRAARPRAARTRSPQWRPLPPPRPAPARSRAQTRNLARKIPTSPASRPNYQPIILAEFAAAVLLTAGTPFATKKGQPGLSPYEGKDITKLAAITVLYFILALISTGGRGPARLSAWFGGLILLTVGLAEAVNVAKDLDLFGIGGSPGADTGPEATGTTQTGNTIAGRG